MKKLNVTLILIAALLLLVFAALHYNLASRLAYPPNSDQTMYLAGAKYFAAEFRFFWRSPFYGAWMGVFYLLSGYDLQLCFYLEKYTSLFLFALSVAGLGYRLFDTRTAILMGLWVLNLKYVVLETNSSHILAATLFVCSTLCLLTLNEKKRLPVALLVFFLSTQVRSEMWVPLFFIIACLLFIAIKRYRSNREMFGANLKTASSAWVACAVVVIGLTILFNSRLSPREPGRLAEAFAMNFALNYIDRNHLVKNDSDTDTPWMQIWVDALPGVSKSVEAIELDREEIHPFTAIQRYPAQMKAHILYNLKLAVVAFPAVFLAFDNRILMAIILLIYILSFFIKTGNIRHPEKWQSLAPEVRQLLFLWLLAILLLIPISFALRVVARYYVQLIPLQLALAMAGLRMFMHWLAGLSERKLKAVEEF
jgi:hypothetical protein